MNINDRVEALEQTQKTILEALDLLLVLEGNFDPPDGAFPRVKSEIKRLLAPEDTAQPM